MNTVQRIVIFNLVLVMFSALLAQTENSDYMYISPRNGANYISIYNNILIRYGEKLTGDPAKYADKITIVGSKSGGHSVKSLLADDGETIIFQLESHFAVFEDVTVNFLGGIESIDGNTLPQLTVKFTTSRKPLQKYFRYGSVVGDQSEINLKSELIKQKKYDNNDIQSELDTLDLFGMNSIPEDYVTYRFNKSCPGLPGYIFITPFSVGQNFATEFTYSTIIDNYGVPIFYEKIDGFGIDAQVQPNGLLTFYYQALEGYIAINNKYEVVDTIRCGNGYLTDYHEMRIRENGHYLVLSYDHQPYAMDTVVTGGNPNATVIGAIVQEIDENNHVVFQWRSWDHMNITDANNISFQDSLIDCVHTNAIAVDLDGNLLISSRHLSEITKIDRNTGDIIWRMGGNKNQLTFLNDDRWFSYQHHIRVLPNGNYTLFDNGNYLSPQYSSALEYKVDDENMTAELVWSYNDGSTLGGFMGSTQRLENGNTMIGWGGTHPSLTEVSYEGEKLLEIDFSEPYLSYRAFRYDWQQGVFSANEDTLNFQTNSGEIDTSYVEITNNLSKDLTINTAVTRTESFSVTNGLPFDIAAGQTKLVGIIVHPNSSENIHDVLTLRADSETEGYGIQFQLNSNKTTDVNNEGELTKEYSLSQNYPNPFNPATQIIFNIPKSGNVELKVYDVLGRQVAKLVDEYKTTGSYKIGFDGSSLTSGIYFYKLISDNFIETKKMMLIK